jgi:hypothetical protein
MVWDGFGHGGFSFGIVFLFFVDFFGQWADSVLQVLGWRFAKKKNRQAKGGCLCLPVDWYVSRKPWLKYYLQ